eukprot:358535-Chlamydomonas_euryale.AAC.2
MDDSSVWVGDKKRAEETSHPTVRVRVTGSGPNWVCLCETKQAIEDTYNLQEQRQEPGKQAGGGHQPNSTRRNTTLHPVTLGSSHRSSSTTGYAYGLWMDRDKTLDPKP